MVHDMVSLKNVVLLYHCTKMPCVYLPWVSLCPKWTQAFYGESVFHGVLDESLKQGVLDGVAFCYPLALNYAKTDT